MTTHHTLFVEPTGRRALPKSLLASVVRPTEETGRLIEGDQVSVSGIRKHAGRAEEIVNVMNKLRHD
jgi:hypothetical protein